VSVGRIDDGLRALSSIIDQTTASSEDEFARTAAAGLAGAAVQLGRAELAIATLDGVVATHPDLGGQLEAESKSIGRRDTLVARGLAELMRGGADAAVPLLERAVEPDVDGIPSSYALSALALAAAATGDAHRVVALAEQVAEGTSTTYSDRATAGVARLLCRSAAGDQSVEPEWNELVAMVDATDDRVVQAIVALARARGLAAVGSPAATAAAEEADRRLHLLDLAAEGWQAIFDQVLGPVPASL
jgi:hypothetical protein